MRLTCKASSTLAVFAVSLSAGACEPLADALEEPTQFVSPGSEFMAQQAPQVQRATASGARGPRMDPSEASGRWPFYWTRAAYSGYGRGGWGRGGSWATDFPKGDRQFLFVLKRLVRLDAHDWENAVSLADPVLRRFPVIYMVEPGYMDMTDSEVAGLRRFLDAGGFLIVDDFHGPREWTQFAESLKKVFWDRPIVDIPEHDEIFHVLYDVDQRVQIPGQQAIWRGVTWEHPQGVPAHWRGVYDDDGRLLVAINFNMDLGDAWEHADDAYYPEPLTALAYRFGVNYVIYSMTH